MDDRARQLAFDLPLDPRFGAEDFLVSPSNEAAYAMVERWPNWADSILLLVGPPGSGKSHLASIWASRAHAWKVDARTLVDERVLYLISNGTLLIEDADKGIGSEAGLFHLLNLARERNASVLITAASSPDHWGLRVPDLVSRLRLAPRVDLAPSDDALLKAVLVKLFVDRQLVVDTTIVDYVALRIERSLAQAADFVARLDREALSRGRRITRSMASVVLEEMSVEASQKGAIHDDEG